MTRITKQIFQWCNGVLLIFIFYPLSPLNVENSDFFVSGTHLALSTWRDGLYRANITQQSCLWFKCSYKIFCAGEKAVQFVHQIILSVTRWSEQGFLQILSSKNLSVFLLCQTLNVLGHLNLEKLSYKPWCSQDFFFFWFLIYLTFEAMDISLNR